MKVILSRRSLLVSLATIVGTRFAFGADLNQCRAICGRCDRLPDTIALVATLTGWAANVGSQHSDGARLAVDQINDAGGSVSLLVLDSEGSPSVALALFDDALNRGAQVVIGVLGGSLASAIAKRYRHAIFIDLGGEKSAGWAGNLRNVFTLPLDVPASAESSLQSAACPKGKYALQAYTAIQLIAAGSEKSGSSDVNDLMRALERGRFPTAVGTIGFADDTREFQLR